MRFKNQIWFKNSIWSEISIWLKNILIQKFKLIKKKSIWTKSSIILKILELFTEPKFVGTPCIVGSKSQTDLCSIECQRVNDYTCSELCNYFGNKEKNLPFSPAFFCCFLFPETKTNLCRLNFSNAFDWRETHLNESRDFFIGGNVTNYNVNIYLHSGRFSVILLRDPKILEKTQFDSF